MTRPFHSRSIGMGALSLLAGFGLLTGVSQAAIAAPPSVPTVDAANYLVYKQEPAYFQYKFSSPSGNLRCQITQYEDSAPWGCVAIRHTWKDPKLPVSYPGACGGTRGRLSGAMLAVYPRGGFAITCDGDLPGATGKSKALPFNTRIVANGITCTSLSVKSIETMRCTGLKQTSFTMSRATLSFRQPAGWR